MAYLNQIDLRLFRHHSKTGYVEIFLKLWVGRQILTWA